MAHSTTEAWIERDNPTEMLVEDWLDYDPCDHVLDLDFIRTELGIDIRDESLKWEGIDDATS